MCAIDAVDGFWNLPTSTVCWSLELGYFSDAVCGRIIAGLFYGSRRHWFDRQSIESHSASSTYMYWAELCFAAGQVRRAWYVQVTGLMIRNLDLIYAQMRVVTVYDMCELHFWAMLWCEGHLLRPLPQSLGSLKGSKINLSCHLLAINGKLKLKHCYYNLVIALQSNLLIRQFTDVCARW